MTQLQGLVEHVETEPARSFAEADAAISDTVVYVAQIAPFLTESGACVVDIAGVEYAAEPDTEAASLTLSPALSVAVTEGDPITLVPDAEIKWAFVMLDGDDTGDWIQCRVPHELVGYVKFGDGPRDPEDREAVLVETEPEPFIVTMLNQPTSINATTTPIVVTTEDGESVRVDGDGLAAFTNDFPQRGVTITGTFIYVAAADGFVFAIDSASDIRKFDADTGVENLSGFPIVGTFNRVAAADGFVFAIDSASDIRKFDADTGVENLSGFPIVGTFGTTGQSLAAAEGFIYATDSSTEDIRKFDADTGVENLSGFPIVGAFAFVAAADGFVFAIDSGTGDIRKFDADTGVENLSGFPITGAFWYSAAADGFIYAGDFLSQDLRKFDADTGVENLSGFPIVGLWSALAADTGLLVGRDTTTDDIFTWTYPEGFESVRIESGRGSIDVRGQSSLTNLGHYNHRSLRNAVSPTSTANINLPELSMTFTVNGPSDVVWVELAATVTISVNNTVNIIEMLVDGAADTTQLITRFPAATVIVAGFQKWRLRGLATGSHTIEFRTRNTAAATSATINATHTSASYWTST